jgi:hypothetical protein
MLQFGTSLTDDASSVNYDRNMFIIQATGCNTKGSIPAPVLDSDLRTFDKIRYNKPKFGQTLTKRTKRGPNFQV